MSSRRSRALSAGLVGVDLRQPGVDGRISGDQAVDVREPEEPVHAMHHRVDRRDTESGLAEGADVQLEVSPLDPDQRVHEVGLAPGEPAAQLVGVQRVGCARSSERGRTPPRAGPVSSRRAGTATASRGWCWSWSWRPPAAWRPCPSRGPPHTAGPLEPTLDLLRPGASGNGTAEAASQVGTCAPERWWLF